MSLNCYARAAFGGKAIGPFLLRGWILGQLGMRLGVSVDGPAGLCPWPHAFPLGFLMENICASILVPFLLPVLTPLVSLGSYSKNLQCEMDYEVLASKAAGRSPDLAVVC